MLSKASIRAGLLQGNGVCQALRTLQKLPGTGVPLRAVAALASWAHRRPSQVLLQEGLLALGLKAAAGNSKQARRSFTAGFKVRAKEPAADFLEQAKACLAGWACLRTQASEASMLAARHGSAGFASRHYSANRSGDAAGNASCSLPLNPKL